MPNADTQAARQYHEDTKHSVESILRGPHSLDWANQPRPYKLYVGLDALPLPSQLPALGAPALGVVSAPEVPPTRTRIPDLPTLATVLQLSAGITKRVRYPGGVMAFRAAACTGALYHIELYLVCGDLPGLPAGVYQFGVHDGALRPLRRGDYRGVLVRASAQEPSVTQAPVIIVCTSTFWRNAWKYQTRAYRHAFWDTGAILANLLALAAAFQLPARVVLGFVDTEVNRLVDVDGEREAAISLVSLGRQAEATHPWEAPPVEPLRLPTLPLSRREVDYPGIRAMHTASSLMDPEEVAEWRQAARADPGPATVLLSPGRPGATADDRRQWVELQPLSPEAIPTAPIEDVIRRRGSARRFELSSIGSAALSTLLAATTAGTPADVLSPGQALATPYLIVNAVDGLASGAYVFHRQAHALERLWGGDFRAIARHLALGQDLGGEAAVCVYFLAHLDPILDRLGNRGYRAAQLDAAITAGRLYLAAYALGLGATGLTFFDDDVTAFFSPHAADASVLFLIALGNPARGRSPRYTETNS